MALERSPLPARNSGGRSRQPNWTHPTWRWPPASPVLRSTCAWRVLDSIVPTRPPSYGTTDSHCAPLVSWWSWHSTGSTAASTRSRSCRGSSWAGSTVREPCPSGPTDPHLSGLPRSPSRGHPHARESRYSRSFVTGAITGSRSRGRIAEQRRVALAVLRAEVPPPVVSVAHGRLSGGDLLLATSRRVLGCRRVRRALLPQLLRGYGLRLSAPTPADSHLHVGPCRGSALAARRTGLKERAGANSARAFREPLGVLPYPAVRVAEGRGYGIRSAAYGGRVCPAPFAPPDRRLPPRLPSSRRVDASVAASWVGRRPVTVLAVYQARLGGIVHSRFRRNVVTTGAVGVAVYGLGLATGPILARSLGPSGRGDLAAVLVPAQLLCFGLAFGLPSAAAYLVHRFDRGTLLATSTVFGLVVGIPLVLAVWPLLPGYYQHHGAAALFWAQIFLVSAPLSVGAGVALSLLWADGANLRWNLWRTAPTAADRAPDPGPVHDVPADGMDGAGRGFRGRVLDRGPAGAEDVRVAAAQVSLKALRAQLSYGARVAIGSAADTVAGRFDQALMVAMVPSADLGLYAVAVTAAGLSGPLTSSLGLALFPELRRENSADAQRRRTSRALAAVLVSSTGVAAVLAFAGPWLLAFLFGKSFADAATPLRLLLLGQIANDATGPLTARLLAAGRPGAASQASAAAAVVTVVGLVLLVPRLRDQRRCRDHHHQLSRQVRLLSPSPSAGARPQPPSPFRQMPRAWEAGTDMSVAIVHDYVTQRGGAERVLLSMLKAYPTAPLYTSLYSPKTTFPEFQGRTIETSQLNRLPFLRGHHRLAFPVLAPAVSRLRVPANVVLCSSSGWAHGVPSEGRKIVFCHAPARWLYQTDAYLGSRRPVARSVLGVFRSGLARWDRRAAQQRPPVSGQLDHRPQADPRALRDRGGGRAASPLDRQPGRDHADRGRRRRLLPLRVPSAALQAR